MKFFPAALAVLALASCSNDDLLGISTDNVQREAGKLYVQVEDLQDGMNEASTRAGFVYGTTTSGNANGQYFVWTKGDTVKIYDDNQNWRTQIWEYDGEATKAYKKADGFSVFSKIKQIAGVKADEAPTQYTNAYGVTPAAIGKFANEDRTALEFNLSSLAYWEADRAAVTDVYTDGMLSKAPIPMWGVATSTDGSSEMKVKYLTGILKVDIAQLPKTADNTVNVLVIQSKVATASTIVNLHPEVATAAFAPESTDKAPELQVKVESGTATTISASLDCTSAVPADIMVINLGEIAAANDKKRCCVVVPIPVAVDNATGKVAQEQTIAAYLGTAAKATPKNITTLSTSPIGGAITKTVASGKYYLIQDKGAYALTGVNTLNLLEAKIKELDAASDRDFTITLQENIPVKNGNDEDGYVLDLSGYQLKNNVTVTFKSGVGFIKDAIDGGDLEIRTKAGSKTLTFTNTTDCTVKKIIATAKMAGPVVVNGEALTTIEAGSANLTIGCAVTTVNATAETNIDADTKSITTLNINTGCTKVNLLNGTVTTAQFGEPSATPANNKAIAADVEIRTEGNGQIGTVDYSNVPKNTGNKTFKYTISYTSKWDGTSTNSATAFTTGKVYALNAAGNAAENITSAIISASQLKGYDGSAARILAKEIDLDGKQLMNATLSAALNGNYSVIAASDNDAAKAAPLAQANIKNNTIGAAGTNISSSNYGLFQAATTSPAVYNLQLSNTKILGKSGSIAANVGALIGQASAEVTIQNVKVTNLTATITGATDYATTGKELNIGGVIGQVTGAVATLYSVTSTGSISANGSLGGIIGNVDDVTNSKAVFGKEVSGGTPVKYSAADMCSSTITLTPTAGQAEYDPVYAKTGTLVGSSDVNAAGVEIYTQTAPVVTIAVPEKAKMSRITSTFAILRYNIERGLDEVGFSGVTAYNATNTDWAVKVYVSNNGSAAATAKDYVVKAFTTDSPNTNGWTIANWAAKTSPVYCGWNISTQYTTE